FMALNVVFAFNTLMQWMKNRQGFDILRAVLVLCVIAVIVPYDILHSTPIFAQHPTSVQSDAALWIRNNVPHNAVIIINNYLYTHLHESGGEGVADGTIYPYAHVYLNVAFDPELHDGLLHNDWNHIDYIVADAEMLKDIKTL